MVAPGRAPTGQKDLDTVLADAPQLLVIGTGYYGRMQVPEKTIESLRAVGIEVIMTGKRGKARSQKW